MSAAPYFCSAGTGKSFLLLQPVAAAIQFWSDNKLAVPGQIDPGTQEATVSPSYSLLSQNLGG